jgi:enoyl-CoA hydratase
MTVRSETLDFVTTVTIDRPHVRNAVDRTTADALADAMRAFEANDDARVAVLCGGGDNFCAGADLQAIAAGTPNRLEPTGDGPMGPTRMQLDKPVIAAISGYAVAGGLELALWCDMRVADTTAVLGVFCRRFGVPLIDGGTVRLPHIVGLGRAFDLILTGRAVAADEALAMGLVDRVVPAGEAIAAAQELARSIAAFPQACMRSDRRAAYGALGMPIADALRYEFDRGRSVLDAADFVEGPRRFARGAGRHGAPET